MDNSEKDCVADITTFERLSVWCGVLCSVVYVCVCATITNQFLSRYQTNIRIYIRTFIDSIHVVGMCSMY